MSFCCVLSPHLAGPERLVREAGPARDCVALRGRLRGLQLAVLVELVADGAGAAVDVLRVVAVALAPVALLAPQLLLAGVG